MNVFADRLRDKAVALGIAHSEVARRSGLTERRYSHYVNGVREPDLATLVRIAEALQTTPNDLLGVGGQKRSSPRTVLVDRLNSAAQSLGDYELEIVVLQTETLANRRPKKSRESVVSGKT